MGLAFYSYLMTKPQHFGVEIREARVAAKMSREELAVLSGTTSDAIADFENETERDPKWSTLARIYAVLGIPASKLDPAVQHAVAAARKPRPESVRVAKALKDQQERMRKRHPER